MICLSELSTRYRITLDESWHHERPEVRRPDRRWYEQIPCWGGGFIFLYSETQPLLGLYTTQVKSARAIMKKLPGLEAEWLDGEAVIYFHPEILDQVAEMAGARKRRLGRKLSAEEKVRLIEAGKAFRFTKKLTGLQGENLARM